MFILALGSLLKTITLRSHWPNTGRIILHLLALKPLGTQPLPGLDELWISSGVYAPGASACRGYMCAQIFSADALIQEAGGAAGCTYRVTYTLGACNQLQQ